MAFDVEIIPSASIDLERGLQYYLKISKSLAQKFYFEFLEINRQLEQNPSFKLAYKNVRTIKLKSFPYIVHFIIEEARKLVVIIAIVFGKQKTFDYSERVNA